MQQLYRGCVSQASYLIVDETSRVAAVVDPRPGVEIYVGRAAELGVRIEHVFLTHTHPDVLAGHRELAQRTGAAMHLGVRSEAANPAAVPASGKGLALGPEVRVVALEAPGREADSVCYLVFDAGADSDSPHAVLTGDTVFI